jgi:hypothetical protein
MERGRSYIGNNYIEHSLMKMKKKQESRKRERNFFTNIPSILMCKTHSLFTQNMIAGDIETYEWKNERQKEKEEERTQVSERYTKAEHVKQYSKR